MAMSQLDMTLIGIEPWRRMSQEAGSSINTHGRVENTSEREPESVVTALAHTAVLIDSRSAAEVGIERKT